MTYDSYPCLTLLLFINLNVILFKWCHPVWQERALRSYDLFSPFYISIVVYQIWTMGGLSWNYLPKKWTASQSGEWFKYISSGESLNRGRKVGWRREGMTVAQVGIEPVLLQGKAQTWTQPGHYYPIILGLTDSFLDQLFEVVVIISNGVIVPVHVHPLKCLFLPLTTPFFFIFCLIQSVMFLWCYSVKLSLAWGKHCWNQLNIQPWLETL